MTMMYFFQANETGRKCNYFNESYLSFENFEEKKHLNLRKMYLVC